MTKLQWDQIGDRRFEAGIEHGVLYLTDGRAVAWSGIISVEDSRNDASDPFYVDGVKYLDREIPGDFAARLKAFTYPDEFEELQGCGEFAPGLLVHDQKPRLFALAYRTRLGNDVDGVDHGYRIHILYNVFAIADETENATLSDSVSPIEFQWDLVCSPSAVAGFRPTAHAIINSTEAEPELIEGLESLLFGTDETNPELPTLQDLTDLAVSFAAIIIVDNGDGTWDAIAPARYLTMLDATTFQINGVDASYSDADTYEVQTTHPT